MNDIKYFHFGPVKLITIRESNVKTFKNDDTTEVFY